MKIVIVTGGTRYLNRGLVFDKLTEYHEAFTIAEMVNGMAPHGVDWFCFEWAEQNGIITRKFPADWKTHGEKAGPIRNQQMLDENPDIDVGLVFPGHRGTIDMTRRLRKASITRIFYEDPAHAFGDWG